MILVWGAATDPPTQRVLAVLRARGAGVLHIGDHDLSSLKYDIDLHVRPVGWIETRGIKLDLADVDGFYLRPGEFRNSSCLDATSTLLAVASCLDANVINRPAAGRSNWSKPYQLRVIENAGLAVPKTLVTTDPNAARSFLERFGKIVYKSVSGVRSIVATLSVDQAARLDGVATGPVQLQHWIDGLDVRVHVVGEEWFATAIESDVTDYRYASLEGASARMTPCDIPEGLAANLVALTRSMGLLLSGIDLRVTAAGQWYCFEVNPSPGFTYFEEGTGQPISEAIGSLLLRARVETETARRKTSRQTSLPVAYSERRASAPRRGRSTWTRKQNPSLEKRS